MESNIERTRRGAGLVWVLVLGCAVGGFGYSFGYANGQGRANEQADERLNQVWQVVNDHGYGEATGPAEESPDAARPGDPAVPSADSVGVAESHASARSDS